MKITLGKKKIDKVSALWGRDLSVIQKAICPSLGFSDQATLTIESDKLPKEFLQLLLDHAEGLSAQQRNKLYLSIHGVAADIDTFCKKASDVQTMISALRASGEFNAEWELGDRWFPVRLMASYQPTSQGSEAYTMITFTARLVDFTHTETCYIGDSFFTDEDGIQKSMSGKEVFDKVGFRYLQQDLEKYRADCRKASQAEVLSGHVVAAIGNCYTLETEMFGGVHIHENKVFGTTQIPKKIVIEDTLEARERSRSKYTNRFREKEATNFPFIRAFSMDLKRYVYMHIDDIAAYKFDKNAIDNLVLPLDKKTLISKLFTAESEQLFGDVLQDKHGGMIILANGSTGTGKTLTAEIFAEMTERPLYVMEMAELGIRVEKIEENLATIFRRVQKWDAILLLDEADVLLSQRGENLERAVIVGIFLRLMDYYRGLLFLTSNRAEVIDAAFTSRITIRIDYPDHTVESRKKVWQIMLEKAQITVEDGLDGIPDVILNGRQIRNMVRLLRVLYGNQVTSNQVKEVCKFAARTGTETIQQKFLTARQDR